MKKIHFTLLCILLLCIPLKSCFVPDPIDCQWNQDVTVHIRNNYLALPCEDDDCFKDADYAMLSFYFWGDRLETSLYKAMEAPVLGIWDSTMFSWIVTIQDIDCTQSTLSKSWDCSQDQYQGTNSYKRFDPNENIFQEAPRSIDAGSWACKQHYELKIVLHTGDYLIWTKEWLPYDSNKHIPVAGHKEEYFVTYNDNIVPIKSTHYNRNKPKNIYINNQFQTI